ncbi:ribose-phosphate pyrophosphokinase [Spirochaetota bacterium]|nr:ribose-phosphate pyrophosphokinase [Spirochaetota bacterium]
MKNKLATPPENLSEEKIALEAPKHPLKIIALNSGRAFAQKICHHLNNSHDYPVEHIAPIKTEEVEFANGEIKFVIHESIRGADVYIVQLIDDPLTQKSVNDNLIALASAINAAYYSDAHSITAVIPQFPYSRQDKRKGRESITARVAGELLQNSGANCALTLDIHSEAIEGFFLNLKVENIHMGKTLIEYVKSSGLQKNNLMIVAPDVNSAKRGVFFAKNLKTDLAIIDKVRNYSQPSTISNMHLIGDVSGRDILICDDMLATGSTLLAACRLLKKHDAKNIYAAVALPFFSRKVYKVFNTAYQEENLFNKIIGSNAVWWDDELRQFPWYHTLDATDLFAKVIAHLNKNLSVSELLE